MRPTIVAIGDSVTYGIGDGLDEPDGRVGWAYHAAQLLGADRFANLAANGVRARDLLSDQLPAALAHRPDIVMLTVGGNDVLRGDFDPADVRLHLTAALGAVRRAGAQAVIVSLAEIEFFSMRAMPRTVTRLMASRVAATNAAIERAAAATGALVVDGARVRSATGEAFWHTDRIHPSPAGHRALAREAVARLPRWPRIGLITHAPTRPTRLSRAAWIVRKGIPWIRKRSRDLIPQVTQTILSELARERHERRAAVYARRDHTGALVRPPASSQAAPVPASAPAHPRRRRRRRTAVRT